MAGGQRQTLDNEGIWNERTHEWTRHGKEKAKEYASMTYDAFAERIIDELILGISYTPNIIFILLCGAGVISTFFIMTKVSGEFGLLMLAMYGTACYFLYERDRKDYIAERKQKILNKYK